MTYVAGGRMVGFDEAAEALARRWALGERRLIDAAFGRPADQ